VPDWRTSLENLCRCLKPGGNLVIFEGNMHSLEGWLVKAVRRIQKRKSKMVETAGGLEFWTEAHGAPFLVRLANLDALESAMIDFVIQPQFRHAVALFDLNRFSARLRPWLIPVNRLWFRLNLPFGSAVIVVGRRNHRT
jgi:SAM-dependent methyltransferase